jgi:hypothetical protein
MKRTIVFVAFGMMTLSPGALAQGPIGSLLKIDVNAWTLYESTSVDPSQLGRNLQPGPIPGNTNPLPYENVLGIGDIVSVNGTAAKGTAFLRTSAVLASPTFMPGRAIADVARGGFYDWTLEFMNPDGTMIGTIRVNGMAGGGPRPPGAPNVIARAGYMVLGGTGPFLGAQGYFQSTPDPMSPERDASAAEDLAYRRINGGGIVHLDLYLIPIFRPEIVTTTNGPAIYHADFSPVTAANPTTPGETLIARVTGFGPVKTILDPGDPFPSDPAAAVNSPVAVTVNGQSADVINAIGWPGTSDTYRLDFQIPSGIAAGNAAIRITAAWISGPAFQIPVR